MAYTVPTVHDLTQPELQQALQRAIDQKTKPLGALGQLETLAVQIGLILGTERPE
ncbi:MAG: nicotinate-nucleotide--dimethylbenzimidazole phosphoribosyltransferase, partial [Pseudomonadota bacterium]